MKTMLSIAALAAATTLTPTAALAQRAPAAVIVVVDTARIYRDCNACKTAQSQLETRLKSLQARQTTLTNQLRTEGEPIAKAIDALAGKAPDAALEARVKAFQTKQNSANEELARGQQNLQSIQANVMRQINGKLGPAINQVMVAQGANLAVDVDATLARSNALDVTAQVVAALNTALPSVSLTPLPQSQQQQRPPQGR